VQTTFTRGVLSRIHWGAVIAGALLALAIEVVLGLFGAAIGLAGAGVLGAIWILCVPLVATFCGAFVAARMASTVNERSSALHGVLVWCIGLLAIAPYLAGTMTTGANTTRTAGTTALAGLAGLLGLGGGIFGALAGRREVLAEGRLPRERITTEERLVERDELEPPPPTHH
jgi:hypothetical protein